MTEDQGLGERYEIVRTISAGPRATVLQALDRVHDRPVALKVYPVTARDRDELLAEARLLMSIAPHPGLPVVRGDFFTEDGGRYVVVLNWVDGTDLQQLLEEQGDPGLALGDVLDDLAQVADALDHLHAHRPPVVHGDVKPANVVRAPDGRVVLVDFEIAGAHAGGERLGTFGYVAPEIAAGHKLTPAADVFGLAATAIALLDGKPPTEAAPTYAGIDPAEQGQVARVLRAGIASDPARRPRSAGRLIANLRGANRDQQPTGVIAFLASEVVDASQLWDRDPDEMRVAMGRLREVRDEVVAQRGGRVVTSMNEGEHTIAVFREASAAALAALELHDRVGVEAFPPDIRVRLQAAVAIGEASLVDGVYTGAVVDQVVRLRSAAAAGSTITTEATAELLLGLVGREVSIIPLGPAPNPGLARGGTIVALTRPGAEHRAGFHQTPDGSTLPAIAPDGADLAPHRSSTTSVAFEALEQSSTIVPATIAGLALIYLAVLSEELGLRVPALVAFVAGASVAAVSFVRRISGGIAADRAELEAERVRRETDARRRAVEQERVEARRRLADGFSRVTSEESADAADALVALGAAFDAVVDQVRRTGERDAVLVSTLLPDLVEETYGHGVSALSDALELLEFGESAQRRRMAAELDEIGQRLALDRYDDERARSRDEERAALHRQLLARHDEARRRARELVFEAERCADALAEAHIELASLSTGQTRAAADGVAGRLQDTIRSVRDVQDELRRLGY